MTEIDLRDGEKIIYQTKVIKDFRIEAFLTFFLGILGAGLIVIGCFYLILDPPQIIGFILYSLLGLFLIVVIIIPILNYIELRRTRYYITPTRVVKEYRLLKKIKTREINFSDIAYIANSFNGIEIVPKGSKGELYFNGTETEDIPTTRETNSLLMLLELPKGNIVKIEIIMILTKYCSLKKHPLLDFIYF